MVKSNNIIEEMEEMRNMNGYHTCWNCNINWRCESYSAKKKEWWLKFPDEDDSRDWAEREKRAYKLAEKCKDFGWKVDSWPASPGHVHWGGDWDGR